MYSMIRVKEKNIVIKLNFYYQLNAAVGTDHYLKVFELVYLQW